MVEIIALAFCNESKMNEPSINTQIFTYVHVQIKYTCSILKYFMDELHKQMLIKTFKSRL